jgi:hypothetical protein
MPARLPEESKTKWYLRKRKEVLCFKKIKSFIPLKPVTAIRIILGGLPFFPAKLALGLNQS